VGGFSRQLHFRVVKVESLRGEERRKRREEEREYRK